MSIRRSSSELLTMPIAELSGAKIGRLGLPCTWANVMGVMAFLLPIRKAVNLDGILVESGSRGRVLSIAVFCRFERLFLRKAEHKMTWAGWRLQDCDVRTLYSPRPRMQQCLSDRRMDVI